MMSCGLGSPHCCASKFTADAISPACMTTQVIGDGHLGVNEHME